MMRLEWSELAIQDLGSLERGIARRVKQSDERFVSTGAGDVKRLQGYDPPEYRLRVGDYRVRFRHQALTITIVRVLNRRDAYR